MLHIESYVPITKAKINLLEIVRSLHDSTDTIAITKNGVPEAVLLSMESYEGLIETLEILSDSETMQALSASIKDERNDRWVDEKEVFDALQD